MMFSNYANLFLNILWLATWQSTVLAIIVLAIILLTRDWIGPRWRVLLWSIPICRMILLIVPASSLSLFNCFSVFSDPSRDALVQTGTVLPASPETTPTFVTTYVTTPTVNAVLAETAPQSQPSGWPALSWQACLASAWLAGFSLVCFRWFLSRIVLRRLLATSTPLANPDLVSTIENFRKQHRVWPPIRCLIISQPIGPATCGLFRPTIILSQQLMEKLDANQLRTILLHELHHICRFDVLLIAISRLATVVHWFNPLAYLLRSRLHREIELAVDAATLDGLADQDRQMYGHLLLALAQDPASKLGLAQMADSKSNLRIRIEAIARPGTNTPIRSAVALAILVVLLVMGLSDVAKTQDQAPVVDTVDQTVAKEQRYFITGTVREEGTGRTIEGAEIVLLVDSEQEQDKRVPSTVSDENGEYRIEVPMGSVRLWFPPLKPGYWLTEEENTVFLLTSPEGPEATHDIFARTGPIWQIQAEGELGKNIHVVMDEEPDDANRAAVLSGESRSSSSNSLASSYSKLSPNGRGAITEVGNSGKFLLGVVNKVTELVVEPGFDNSHVVSAERLPDSDKTQMVDASGKKATVGVAKVTLNDGVPLLTFQVESAKNVSQKLTGIITDWKGNPLSDVRVGVAIQLDGHGGGSGSYTSTNTSSDGHFAFDADIPPHFLDRDPAIIAVVTKDRDASVGELAKSMGVAWPPDERTTSAAMDALKEATFDREIDRVLGVDSSKQ